MLKQLSTIISFLLICGVTIGCFDSTTTAPEPMEQTSISDSLFVALQDSILKNMESDQPAQDSLHQMEIDRVTFYYDSLLKALPQPTASSEADTVPQLNIDSIMNAQQHALDSISNYYNTIRSAQFKADADSLLSHFTDSLNRVHTEQQQLVLDSLHAAQAAHLDSLKAEYNSAVDSITKENGNNSVDSLTLAQEHALDSLNALFADEVDSMKSTVYDSIYNDVVVKSASRYIQVNYILPRKKIRTFIYPYLDSVYNGHTHGNLLSTSITNLNPYEQYTVIATAEIPGITHAFSQTTIINRNTTDTLKLNPGLIVNNLPLLLTTRTAQLNLTIKVIKNGGETTIRSESYVIEVIPPNIYTSGITVQYPSQPEATFHFENYLSTWVQSDLPVIHEINFEAAALHPKGSLVGYQAPVGATDSEKSDIVRIQVKAIYEALRARDIVYINNLFSPSAGQKIKFPNQTINTKAANCIDGTVLFAAALEAAGLEPFIFLMTGHSIVGWRTWQGTNEMEFLETTLTWNADPQTFDYAHDRGMYKFANPNPGETHLIDVSALQKSGINPLSVEMP
ncbi:MAG: hypothetical protein OCD01_04605 [Fibrobacterales bacterium]